MKFLISQKERSASSMNPRPHPDAKIDYVEDRICGGCWQLWIIEVQNLYDLQRIVKHQCSIEIRWDEACELPEIILGGDFH